MVCPGKNNSILIWRFKMKKQYYLLFLIFLFLIYACKEETETEIEYLKKNSSILARELNYNLSEFEFLDEDVESNTVFFLGESHAVADNFLIDYKLFTYLVKEKGFKYYIAELGYSLSYYLNQYLETGNEHILVEIYKELYGTYAYTENHYYFWKNIYSFNQTLPEEKRIKIFGLDIEHQDKLASKLILEILPDASPPPEIEEYIEKLKLNNGKIVETNICDSFINHLKNYEGIYKNYLGENFFHFKIVVRGYINKILAYKNRDSFFYEFREPHIYNTYIDIFNKYPNEKFYGLWGGGHTLTSPYLTSYTEEDELCFAAMLAQDSSIINGKVISIKMAYIDCEYADKSRNYVATPSELNIYNSDLLEAVSDSLVLYKLNSNESPFNEKVYFLDNNSSGSTVNYFQYILKIKGSLAAKKLNLP